MRNKLMFLCILLCAMRLAGTSFVDIGGGLTPLSSGSSAWGDYDNDGDLDIIMTGLDTSSNKITKLYRNDNGLFSDTGSTIIGVSNSSVAWNDYDRDGDIDLLITGRTSSGVTAKIYRNDAGTFVDIAATLTGVWYSSCAWADYDNDGDYDVVIAGATSTSSPFNPTTVIYANSTGVFSSAVTLTGVFMGSVAWADYDGDGDPDLALSGTTSGAPYTPMFKLYQNEAGSFTEASTPITSVYSSSQSWIDYDNDADMDLLVAGYGSSVRTMNLYKNTNGVLSESGLTFTGISNAQLACGDIDNDGDPDIIATGLSSTASSTKVYLNNSGSFSEFSSGITNVQLAAPVLGDLDNDRDLDLILTGNTSGAASTGLSKVYRNDNTPTGLIPGVPTNLRRYISGSYTYLQWDPPVGGGNYTYSIRIGTSSGGNDLLPGMASANGFRKVSTRGHASGACLWRIKSSSLSASYDYYWSVQAVNSALKGSAFSTEATIMKLQVMSPNGAERWKTSETRTVYWSRNPNIAGINLYLSTDNGSNWTLINSSVISASLGMYSFTVPTVVSSQCLVKIASSAVPSIYDVSDAAFIIESSNTSSLQLTSQNNTGATLLAGSKVNITWTSTQVDSVRIDLTNDNGQTWLPIIGSFPAIAGTYEWTVPDYLSQASFIRIAHKSNISLYDWNNNSFKILRLRLTSPNGGEKYKRGQQTTITWTTNVTANVGLQYSNNNGANWYTLASSVAGPSQSYTWTIPSGATAGDQYLIRLYLYSETSVLDLTDATFTVMALDVGYPSASGIRLQAGKTCNITWTQSFVSSLLKLEYTTDGTNFTSIQSSINPGAGTYAWTVPSNYSTTSKIRLSLMDDAAIYDLSDNDFSICGLNLSSPDGSEVLTSGTTHVIRWTQTNITNVKLEYSTNSGTSWSTIVASVAASTLSYSWTVPSLISYEALIRVSDASLSSINDVSNSIFTIRPPIIVVAPNGGESLTVGSSYNIRWTVSGSTPFVLIDYTINNGSTWLPLVTEAYPSSVGAYSWLVPNSPSANCRIRIRKSTDTSINDLSDNLFTITPTIFPPSPNFSADVTEGIQPLVVQFTDASQPGSGSISSWNWNFGDETSSNIQNPTHTYNTPGMYSVSLTVTNSYDSTRTETKSNYITVISNLPVIALLSANSLDFGSVLVGDDSPVQLVRYKNIGTTPLLISSLDLPPDSGFTYERLNSRFTLNSGEIDSLLVCFNPNQLGQANATLVINNSSGNSPQLSVNLLGEGLALLVPQQFSTIQAAINASRNGNYVVVDNGVYYENIQIAGKEITLASRYIVDGDSTHIANTIVDGSQIRNPDTASVIAILPGDNPYQSPHIIGLTIRNGRGWLINETVGSSIVQKRVGGGIYIKQSNPIFTANVIVDNDADDEGGGSYAFLSMPNWGGIISGDNVNPGGNRFLRNTSDLGKDLYINSSHTRDVIPVENCEFEVFCSTDTTLTNYWATTTNPVRYQGSRGDKESISADLYVATNGDNEMNTGLSPASPFKSIDYALSLAYGTADNPVTIHVASGIYSADFTAETFPLQMVDWVSLVGEGVENTVIDAGASSVNPTRIITCDNVQGVSISDISLINGYVTNAKNMNGGGLAILNSNVEVSNVAINNSFSSGDGAGIYAFNSIVNCNGVSIEYNQATGSGGGISAESTQLTLENSILSHNFTSKHGGGIYQNSGQLSLIGNNIKYNNANSIQMRGGGISMVSIANPILTNNIIASNSGFNGGGISMQNCSSLMFKSNKIANNVATNWGGGLYHISSTGNLYNNLIANNTASQRGGAMYSNSSLNFQNCTIANNRAFSQGGAVYAIGMSSTFLNSILWNNSAPLGNELYLYDNSTPGFNYCNIAGGSSSFGANNGVSYSGTYINNISSDPLFVAPTSSYGVSYDALAADWSLQLSSPCVNSGNPATDVSAYPQDIAGSNRIISEIIDIGAYETNDELVALISTDPTSSLDFGTLTLNSEPVTLDITISNPGTVALVVTDVALQNSGTSFQSAVDFLNTEIPPAASEVITITFTPSSLGLQQNSLLISSNAHNHPIKTITLRANVINLEALISSDPATSIDFGEHIQAADTLYTNLVISNVGSAPLSISDIGLSQLDSVFSWFCNQIPQDVLPDSSLTISIGFSTAEIGSFSNTITINNSSTNAPILSINLLGSVIQGSALISTQPADSINFGQLQVSAIQQEREIIVTNSGNIALEINELNLENPGSPFTLSDLSLPITINPGASESILVYFTPSEVGTYNDVLTIANNSVNTPTLSLDISAVVNDLPVIIQGNVTLQVMGYDAVISWEEFTVMNNGIPSPAELYIVLYSEKADASPDDYYFHGVTEATTYTHYQVARFRQHMFYRVVGLSGVTRQSVCDMLQRSDANPYTWKELKARINESNKPY